MIDGILPGRGKKTPTAKINTEQLTEPLTQMSSGSVIEPTFRPPEDVAAETTQPKVEKISSTKVSSFEMELPEPTDTTSNKRRFIPHLSKKQLIIVASAFVLVAGCGAGVFALTHKTKKAPPAQTAVEAPKPVEPPKPTVYKSPLTGVVVKQEEMTYPVTGIMIENSPDARPQSGLKEAGIVYEAIAEGGITRFLALFQESQPDYIGPVRSVRPYYLEWLQGYDAAIAHVGGSPEALSLIKSAGVKDLDQYYNAGAYWRINSRYAPHNMYTSMTKLRELGTAKGYTASKFTGFARKEDAPVAAPNANSIDLTLSGYLYNAHYDYVKESNSYNRSEGGKPHMDDKSGAQLNSKVVIGLVIPFSIQADGLHSDYSTTGSGRAYIFQDGTVTVGTWSKAGSKDQLLIGDANGSPLALNAGQTWITVVKSEGSVTYK